jgi:hypothetical protein
MFVLNRIKKDNELKRYYDRKKAEGKNAICIERDKEQTVEQGLCCCKRGALYVTELET